MEELIQSINSLSETTWTEILIIIAPIILSIVAILISIYTVRKQNKIALFEKRMIVYDEITSLKAFFNNLEKCIDNEKYNIFGGIKGDVLHTLLKTSLKINVDNNKIDIKTLYLARLDRTLTSACFLFDFIEEKDTIKLLYGNSEDGFSKFYKLFNMLFSHKHDNIKSTLKEAQKELDWFINKYIEKMQKQLKL